ncbi:relaxase/mobilization nuclease domain-containing protein [Pedobacter sp. MC2016-15]|uniref:relaxase/mobilization nuclease domain-containing protein n=1 Tax=Pedobacter sp. MC2016-15 TaxID=2994473 RepID=UPI0022458C64|nr:relaxase/mobilization nuclease domain-containing protein [Pedobacter sp. MC2016-15]MCX2479336.1 relaxase/mobilization nuclease domain-containing protein [Pedobacter sp. MC2016-15]
MVARISIGKSIRGTLHYNENKVDGGEAHLLMASGFAGDIEQMTFMQKLNRFNHLLQLKPDVKTNTVHISLNFHSSENHDDSKLQKIATSYMNRIGFGDQPFLVYRHDDAAHQHLHILTTNITANAERIDLHDIGRKRSEPARKAIEEEYDLIKAESHKLKLQPDLQQVDLEKVQYGAIPTKRAISNTVTAVTRDYKFTTLAEYNAILKCFNVMALRGESNTPMYNNKGLMFSLIDKAGNPIGVPIKSSSFYSKPTLRNLEKKFEKNIKKKSVFKEDLKARIDTILKSGRNFNEGSLKEEAAKLNVDIIYRRTEQGLLFGITFVDHKNKVVFNGSELGKSYAAKAVNSQFLSNSIPQQKSERSLRPSIRRNQTTKSPLPSTTIKNDFISSPKSRAIPLEPDANYNMSRRRKKRKKRNQQINQGLKL